VYNKQQMIGDRGTAEDSIYPAAAFGVESLNILLNNNEYL